MEDRQLQVLIEQAEVQHRLGNHRGACELLQRALSLDPDHARAHAALAFVLVTARRLPAARIELRAALALDADDGYVHFVAAAVLRASRELDDAWAHCLIALEADRADAATYVLGAAIRELQGDRARARELLHEALAIDAAHTGALTRLAQLELEAGDREGAAEHIALALRSDPADLEAHVVAGFIALAAGDAEGAERHAGFVLNQDATHQHGLQLWTAVKARRSRVLGVWWRWNTWVSLGDDRRQVAMLIGTFVVVRVAIIVTDELGHAGLSRLLSLAWLGLCAYTWFAPVLFRRWLKRDLGTVTLDPDY